jgi:hypothetical protein
MDSRSSSNLMFPDRLIALSWDDAWVEVAEIVRDHCMSVLASGSYPLAEFVEGDPSAVRRVAERVFEGVFGEVLRGRDASTVKRLWSTARSVAGFPPPASEIPDEESVATPSAALETLLEDVGEVIGELIDHCLAASLPEPPTSADVLDTGGFDLGSWAGRVRLSQTGTTTDDLLVLTDHEITLTLSRRSDAVVVERISRGGPRQLRGSFSSVDVALRYLVMTIGAAWRSEVGRERLTAEHPAPGTMLEEGPTALHLSWSSGWAEFPQGVVGRKQALEFSRVARAPLDRIAEAYDSPDGGPL